MTVARSVADVLDRACAVRDRVHGPDVSERVRAATAVRGGAGRLRASAVGVADRLNRAAGAASPRRSARRCTASPATIGVPWVDFAKGQRKDDVMHEHLARFTGTEGVLFVGRAQEKTGCFAPRSAATPTATLPVDREDSTGLVNHFYFYCVDADFGPFFLKFCSYFPYNAKLCLNGHEWAKRQAAKAGHRVRRLDNGFAAVDDPAALQAICDRLGPDADRRAAAQVAGHPAAPVHRRRPGRRLPLRHLDPAGRVLPDPDAGQAGGRAGSSSSRSSATTSTSAAPTRSR